MADDISGYLAAGSAALFGAAIGAGAVVVTSHLIGGTDPGLAVPKNRQFHVAQIPWHQIARQATAMVTPVRAVPAAAALRGDLNSLLRVALDRVLLAALVLGAVANRGASRRAAFAGSTLAVMVIGGPALAAETSIVGHQFFPIPPRYGLPLLPGAALSLGQAASGRRAGIALGVFAVATVAVTMGCLALG